MTATVVLTVPVRARAEDKVAAAKKAYARGDRAFRAGNYPTALQAFEEGYKLSGKALFLLNIAHSKHLMNDAKGALESYAAFLETNPEPEDREIAEKAIAELKAAMPPEPEAVPVQTTTPEPPPVNPEPEKSTAKTVPEAALVDSPAEPSPGLTSRWYFWAGVAAVVVTGVVVGVLVSGDDKASFQMTGNWGAVRL